MHDQPTPDLGQQLYDVRGRRLSKGNTPGVRRGRPPGNRGRKYPPDR